MWTLAAAAVVVVVVVVAAARTVNYSARVSNKATSSDLPPPPLPHHSPQLPYPLPRAQNLNSTQASTAAKTRLLLARTGLTKVFYAQQAVAERRT